MWMPAHTTLPPGATASSARTTKVPHRGEENGRVEGLRRPLARVARPHRPFGAGEFLARGVPFAGEGEDAPALVPGHLGHEVGRRPEAVQAQRLPGAGQPQRAKANEAGAQQRRGVHVVHAVRKRKAVAGVGDGALGVAAVQLVAGEAGLGAEVLSVRRGSSGRCRPSNPATGRPPVGPPRGASRRRLWPAPVPPPGGPAPEAAWGWGARRRGGGGPSGTRRRR